MSFLRDDEVKSYLTGVLQKVNIDGRWDGIIRFANVWAYNEIVAVLAQRGFTFAQINSWIRGQEYQRSLAIWKCLKEGQAMMPGEFNAQGVDSFDMRKSLDDPDHVFLTATGEIMDPAQTHDQIVVGPFDTSQDLFVPIDPNDPRLGQVTP